MSQPSAVSKDVKWPDMSATAKLAWWGKLVIALVSFGFVFPRVMDPHLKD
jgi:hypothetical protein